MAKQLNSKSIYCVDSSALIHAWRRVYPPAHFPRFWDRMDDLTVDGRLYSTDEVLRELKKKDDELYAWCKKRTKTFLPIDDQLQDQVIEIMAKYPRLVDTTKGRSGADPFVIGLAKMQDPEWVVLSEENPGKQRMPEVCRSEGILCIQLLLLIQTEGWVFK